MKNSRKLVLGLIICFNACVFCSVWFADQRIEDTPASLISTDYKLDRLLQLPSMSGIAPRIFINGTDPFQDWDDCPWINGTGTLENPFVIHDLFINGSRIGSCIYIINTWQYFSIENCSVVSAGTGSYDAGIRVSNSTNFTIRNNTCIQNSRYGIFVNSSTNNILEENNCSANSYGIYIRQTNNTFITSNNCTGNSNYGISLYSFSNNNFLSENICSKNYRDFYLSSANNNTLIGNNCSASSYGVYFASANNNTLIGNKLFASTYGVYLASANNNTLIGNNCSASSYGVYLTSANNNTLIGNNCSASTNGVYLTSANNNTLIGNNFSASSNGVYLYYSNNNTLNANICAGSSNGVYIYHAYNNELRGNICSGGSRGVYFYYSDRNLLIKNNCTGTSNGIYFIVSNNNILNGNNCTKSMIGIYLENANNNTVIGNICEEDFYGFSIISANNNTFKENECIGNVYGFYLEWSNYNQLSRNSVRNQKSTPFQENNCLENAVQCNWFWLIPNANFTTNISTYWEGNWVEFTDWTLGDAPFSYQWNFGDGSDNVTIQNPIHFFGTAGTYTITLTVTDFDGDISVYTIVILVQRDLTWLVISSITGAMIIGIVIVYRKWGSLLSRYFKYTWLKQLWQSCITRIKGLSKKSKYSIGLLACVGLCFVVSISPQNFARIDTRTNVTRADGKLDFSYGLKSIMFLSDTQPQYDKSWTLDVQTKISNVTSSFYLAFQFIMTYGNLNISCIFGLIPDDLYVENSTEYHSSYITTVRVERMRSYLVGQECKFRLNVTEMVYSAARNFIPSNYTEMVAWGRYMDPQEVRDPKRGYPANISETLSGKYMILQMMASSGVFLDSLSVSFSNSLFNINFPLFIGITTGSFLGTIVVGSNIKPGLKMRNHKKRSYRERTEIIDIPFDPSDIAARPRRNLCPHCWQPLDGLICSRCGKVDFSHNHKS